MVKDRAIVTMADQQKVV